MNNFVFVTSNKNKTREITEIMGKDIKIRSLDIPEIQSLDIDEVITAKAKTAFNIVKKPVIVEDISFQIDGLNGLPGPFIKYFLQKIGTEGLIKIVGESKKSTTSIAAIAAYDGKKLKIFKGIVRGTLTKKSLGESGFGFDRIFIPTGSKLTFAQMDPKIKNEISHRAIALQKLKKYLNSESNLM